MTHHSFTIASFLVAYFVAANGFLLEPDGCVWYGQCGQGWNRGKLNCPADDTNKMAPLMTDPVGLQIIRDYCPDLYRGDNNTRTCCSVGQLKDLKSNMGFPKGFLGHCPGCFYNFVKQICNNNTRTCCSVGQLKDLKSNMGFPKGFLGHCPGCFYNFVNQICQLTCSPEQSRFLWADMSAPKPSHYTTGIPSVTYVLTNEFINALYESCVDVSGFLGLKALGFLCGRKVQDCSPEIWLQYLGTISNGRAPFPIKYVFNDGESWTAPDGKVLTPLQTGIARCNKPLDTQSAIMGKDSCSCRECRTAKPCIANPRPTSGTRETYFDQLFGKGRYDRVEIVVQRKDSQATFAHQLPPPSTDFVNFTSIYGMDFLHQVLDLQNDIAQLEVSSGGSKFTFDDVCKKVNNQPECVIESVLQYFQNNVTKIDKVVYDQYNIYLLGDYLDHFSQCSLDPTVGRDALPYHMSCNTEWGGYTQPYIVLEGYNGNSDYPNATSFVITFVLKTGDSKVSAWKTGFENFMKSYNNPNMTVTYTTYSHTFRSVQLLDLESQSVVNVESDVKLTTKVDEELNQSEN